jgi:hypothetical protein
MQRLSGSRPYSYATFLRLSHSSVPLHSVWHRFLRKFPTHNLTIVCKTLALLRNKCIFHEQHTARARDYYIHYMHAWGARWRSWLRHYATNRNVAGSIPDGAVRRADSLTTHMCRLSEKSGSSSSCIPKGLSRPVMGLLCLHACIHTYTHAYIYISTYT